MEKIIAETIKIGVLDGEIIRFLGKAENYVSYWNKKKEDR